MRFLLQISVCQSSMAHEGCRVNCPTRVGNLEHRRWRESARRVLSCNQVAVDCVRYVAMAENKPKWHRSAREMSRETVMLCSNVHRIIYHDLQLKCLKRHAQSEANRISSLIRW